MGNHEVPKSLIRRLKNTENTVCVCVCVCVLPPHLIMTGFSDIGKRALTFRPEHLQCISLTFNAHGVL